MFMTRYYGKYIAIRNNKILNNWNSRQSFLSYQKKSHRNTDYFMLNSVTEKGYEYLPFKEKPDPINEIPVAFNLSDRG